VDLCLYFKKHITNQRGLDLEIACDLSHIHSIFPILIRVSKKGFIEFLQSFSGSKIYLKVTTISPLPSTRTQRIAPGQVELLGIKAKKRKRNNNMFDEFRRTATKHERWCQTLSEFVAAKL
jgi:hypothetical protein